MKNLRPETAINFSGLTLRLAAGLMLLHGWKKLANFKEMSADFADPLHVGHVASLSMTVFAEFFCTFFILAGLFTRLAVIPPIICMLVVTLVVHSDDPFSKRELGLLYLFLYLAILVVGPGKYSLDRAIRKIS